MAHRSAILIALVNEHFFYKLKNRKLTNLIHTNSNSTGSQGTAVTKHGILVHSDVAEIAQFLDLVAYAKALESTKINHISARRKMSLNMMFYQWNKCTLTSQAKRPEIPQDKVVLSSAGDKLVSLAHQVLPEGNSVGLDLLSIGLEPW